MLVYPFRYYGGKVQIYDWLISHFPASFSFVDVFGGSGVVALNVVGKYKRIVYNDVDKNVVNFFKILRTRPDELISQIELTPVARDEHEESWLPTDNDVENARRFFVRMTQSFNNYGLGRKVSWLGASLESKRNRVQSVNTRVQSLYDVADRLKYIEVENKHFVDLIAKESHRNNFLFADPPYVNSTRCDSAYKYDMTDEEHERLFHLLDESPSNALVCGHPSDLYADLYHHWHRHDYKITNCYVAQRGGDPTRTECVWIKNSRNPNHQAGLFD